MNRDFPLSSAESEKPLVSVIIPTYNRRELISGAVESCISQTWKNIEVIIIDDGSTDETEKFIAHQVQGAWSGTCVRYHRQLNNGAPSARNMGLALSRGKYVQFLDSDDVLFPEKIERQVSALEHGKEDSEICLCYGQLELFGKHVRIGVCCESIDDYILALCSNVVHEMQTSSPLFLRSFLIGRRGWREDLVFGQDLEYFVRLILDANKILFVDRELFLVREHGGDRISDWANDRRRVIASFKTRQLICQELIARGRWNAAIQCVSLRAVRGIYFNILRTGAQDDVQAMERWLRKMSAAPSRKVLFPVLISLRMTVGQKNLLAAIQVCLRVRRQVSWLTTGITHTHWGRSRP